MSKASPVLPVILCLLLLTVALDPGVGAAGSGSSTTKVPTGSYMQTCYRCILGTGTSYSCQCKTSGGGYNSTSIDLSTCALGSGGYYYLVNNESKLICAQSGSSRPSSVTTSVQIPSSTYMETCNTCVLGPGTSYSCQCQNKSSVYISTTIDLSTCQKNSNGFTPLDNNNGHLVCGNS